MNTEHEGTASNQLFRFAEWREFGDRLPDDEGVGPARAADIEGRCGGCWGPVTVLIDADLRSIRLECPHCGRHVREEDAVREVERMAREAEDNMAKVRVGRAARYRKDARFVLKILPDMDRDKEWFMRRVTAALATVPKLRCLGRRDFRSGGDEDAYAAAGFLYAQVSALVSGLSALPDRISAIDLRDFDFDKREMADIEASAEGGPVRLSAKIPYRRPSGEAMTRMGTALIMGMSAAFACEVGMKAILITRLDAAEKTHDLQELYKALPEDCRARLEGDFLGIVDVLEENRHTFGKWRYFEGHALKHATQGLVNEDRARGLLKAARVIADECVVAGLQYDYHLRYEYDGQMTGYFDEDLKPVISRDPSLSTTVKMELGGHESAIPWDAIMALDPKSEA